MCVRIWGIKAKKVFIAVCYLTMINKALEDSLLKQMLEITPAAFDELIWDNMWYVIVSLSYMTISMLTTWPFFFQRTNASKNGLIPETFSARLVDGIKSISGRVNSMNACQLRLFEGCCFWVYDLMFDNLRTTPTHIIMVKYYKVNFLDEDETFTWSVQWMCDPYHTKTMVWVLSFSPTKKKTPLKNKTLTAFIFAAYDS